MFEEETAWQNVKAREEIKEPVKVSYEGNIAKGQHKQRQKHVSRSRKSKTAANGSYDTAITEAFGTVSGENRDSLQMKGQDDSSVHGTHDLSLLHQRQNIRTTKNGFLSLNCELDETFITYAVLQYRLLLSESHPNLGHYSSWGLGLLGGLQKAEMPTILYPEAMLANSLSVPSRKAKPHHDRGRKSPRRDRL